jgi:hypothetical protein
VSLWEKETKKRDEKKGRKKATPEKFSNIKNKNKKPRDAPRARKMLSRSSAVKPTPFMPASISCHHCLSFMPRTFSAAPWLR